LLRAGYFSGCGSKQKSIFMVWKDRSEMKIIGERQIFINKWIEFRALFRQMLF